MWSWCKPTCQHRMETCGTLGNSELASKYNVLIWVFVSLLHSFSTIVLAIFILKYRKHDLFWTQWKYAENSIWSETRVSKIETQAKYLIPLIWTAVKSQFSNGYPIVCAVLLAKHARIACSLSQRFDNKSPEIITITMFLCCFFFSSLLAFSLDVACWLVLVRAQETLQLRPVGRRDAGVYTCQAQNSVGSSEQLSVQLDIKCK